ncbi:MAG: helicase [Desulfovibrio desulfuricans]|nr:helicase [Desulfovibrio desulfuricans]
MNFRAVLDFLRTDSLTEKEKGTRFERLIKAWFRADPRYAEVQDVWLWEEFAPKAGFENKDLGIDLVACTKTGDFWAIQCKFYAENAPISKAAVDSFISNSGRVFTNPLTGQPNTTFAARYWVSTSYNWGPNALDAVKNQQIPFQRITLEQLQASEVDWDALLRGKHFQRVAKAPMDHQREALQKGHEHFASHDRGKLIMACGTGKTYTSLAFVEQETKGNGTVLFLVPSISLLNQSLNAWMGDTQCTMHPICICSDPKSSRKKGSDDAGDAVIDLALPATTDPYMIAERFGKYRKQGGLTVVFSTYQSIDAVAEAQNTTAKHFGDASVFDWIICDEAHRTTGIKLKDAEDESAFTKIHDADFIKGRKRLYMTATPRLYGESAKVKAKEQDCILCSMDDESLYGKEFYRVGFSYAVSHGLLTDYKVLVLTVGSEADIPDSIRSQLEDPDNKELNFDAASRFIGCINGLAKNIIGDNGVTWQTDPQIMRRAIAFCPNIDKTGDLLSSKNTTAQFPLISQKLNALEHDAGYHRLQVTARHIDGSMDSGKRAELLAWLEEDATAEECRVLCNVRCLSEGIDVPALDAVIFLSPRNSQVDVVQSVGRVMRNFRKGAPDGKSYGYIIIPVVVNPKAKPEEVMEGNKDFKTVWSILNALRSHDDRFNATVNKIALNKHKPGNINVVTNRPFGFSATEGDGEDSTDRETARLLEMKAHIAQQLKLFGEQQEAIFGRMVEKVGSRLYWERWANEVGTVAQNFIGRITEMVEQPGRHKEAFEDFVAGLRESINNSVTDAQAVEMLAQHLITRPVFDALFADYDFTRNNPVSRAMENMVNLLIDAGMEKDTAVLRRFYESVRQNVGDIDNLQGKQTIIKNLYEKFFKGAFPKAVDQLGIVYTPVECVDFILHSVNGILQREFGCTLSDKGVHILDPFTGTGTFITRLLQSGIIRPEDMERKYQHEIHCNEMVLLAYYVADVNIESVFHDVTGRKDYLRYDNICLTDTFELAKKGDQFALHETFKDNSETVKRQRRTPIRVIVGNPPYSVGQDNTNDNAQNLKYPVLDKRIEETYVAAVKVTNKNSLYDSYIRAFRWASDRIKANNEGGVIGFITNGGWLDGNAAAGFRKCLEEEFSSIYVFHLRGDARTSGELRRKEGDNVFGLGSRAPVLVTILVHNPKAAKGEKAKIQYHDIGDYLKREQKLAILKEKRSILSRGIQWQEITPDAHGDWLTQRSDIFERFILLGDKKDKSVKETFFAPLYSNGLQTNRDAWVYNYSKIKLQDNVKTTIKFYNEQCEIVKKGGVYSNDATKFSWSRGAVASVNKYKKFAESHGFYSVADYRPFCKINVYTSYSRELNHEPGKIPQLFPTASSENKLICVNGTGGSKDFSCCMTDAIPDVQVMQNGSCFPLYYYQENPNQQGSLLGDTAAYTRKDGITDWILKTVRGRFGNTRAITKETIFYYVYGLLHSPDYRARFAADLKKSLPRIPIVEPVETFMDFALAGRKLADLHLNYEDVPPCPDVLVTGTESGNFTVTKMRFADKATKDCIIYNSDIRVSNIPAKAHEYVVNGKSGIEWILDRYQIRTDKDSGIVNDPNDWAREHGKPRYILDLLLSVINVSVQTVDIVNGLPRLHFGEDAS